MSKLPGDVSISFMRPSGFFKNLFAFVHSIKTQGVIAARYGENDINVFVSNTDIADAIVEELESQVPGRKVRYVASEELSCNKAAGILGAAIGKTDLKWISVTDEQQLEIYKAHGMNESIAAQFVEMNASIHNGEFFKDYNLNKPTFGKNQNERVRTRIRCCLSKTISKLLYGRIKHHTESIASATFTR